MSLLAIPLAHHLLYHHHNKSNPSSILLDTGVEKNAFCPEIYNACVTYYTVFPEKEGGKQGPVASKGCGVMSPLTEDPEKWEIRTVDTLGNRISFNVEACRLKMYCNHGGVPKPFADFTATFALSWRSATPLAEVSNPVSSMGAHRPQYNRQLPKLGFEPRTPAWERGALAPVLASTGTLMTRHTASRPGRIIMTRLILSLLVSVNLKRTTGQCINDSPSSAGDDHHRHHHKRFPYYDEFKDPLLLTPFITTGDLEYGRNLSRVHGFEQVAGDLESYSGFLTVNETHFSHLFFWYFPAEKTVRSTSVLLWLEGGPGAASSLNVLLDNGPLAVDEDSLKIVKRKNHWSKEHHVIYIDQPLGVGYSFTAPDGRPKSLAESTEDLYAALVQFYALFPTVSIFPLYLTGQSYSGAVYQHLLQKNDKTNNFTNHRKRELARKCLAASLSSSSTGKFVPSLARKIGDRNNALRASPHQSVTSASLRLQLPLPLEGIIIGNPMIHPRQNFHYGDFLFGHGMIDEIQRNHFDLQASESVHLADEGRWEESVDVMDQLIFGAFHNDTYFKRVTGFDQYHSTRGPRDTYLFTPAYEAAEAFLSSVATRRNLHVGEMPFLSFSEEILRNFKTDLAQSQLENLEFALDNYRVMLYFGSLDIICNFEAGRRIVNDARRWNRYEEWLHTTQKPWKARFGDLVRYDVRSGPGDSSMPPPPPNVNDEVTFGYVTQMPRKEKNRNDFVFLVVLGAAHSALQDRPEIMQHAVDTFLRHGQF
ncbi:unnamed protein product [Notodromas monacha]|uniref:Carboxypeptidase n=1 Tax=Notodromas monacha TaxID=399045 RepID=A0A7R9BPC9_9CRUS|nr:unnamed protein product [Notodromas monacha]CAG0918356.1 unnamed protein product [Notodromas monacha]